MATSATQPSPRSITKIHGATPWRCVDDLEGVKKAVEQNTRSIEKLEASFTGFQKQHQDGHSAVHRRCSLLEALCEELSGHVQFLLESGTQQHLQEQTVRIDQLFVGHEECVRDTAVFNKRLQQLESQLDPERLERLESQLEQSLSMAADAVPTTDAEDAGKALDGTLAMLANIAGSLEQTHQAIAAACLEGQIKEAVTPVCQAASRHERTKPSPPATPRLQRRAAVRERHRDSSCCSSGFISPCRTRPSEAVTPKAVTPLRKRPSTKAFPTQPVLQAVRKGYSVAASESHTDSPRMHSSHSGPVPALLRLLL
jgi:hypothetical protein